MQASRCTTDLKHYCLQAPHRRELWTSNFVTRPPLRRPRTKKKHRTPVPSTSTLKSAHHDVHTRRTIRASQNSRVPSRKSRLIDIRHQLPHRQPSRVRGAHEILPTRRKDRSGDRNRCFQPLLLDTFDVPFSEHSPARKGGGVSGRGCYREA